MYGSGKFHSTLSFAFLILIFFEASIALSSAKINSINEFPGEFEVVRGGKIESHPVQVIRGSIDNGPARIYAMHALTEPGYLFTMAIYIPQTEYADKGNYRQELKDNEQKAFLAAMKKFEMTLLNGREVSEPVRAQFIKDLKIWFMLNKTLSTISTDPHKELVQDLMEIYSKSLAKTATDARLPLNYRWIGQYMTGAISRHLQSFGAKLVDRFNELYSMELKPIKSNGGCPDYLKKI